ncbi:hypothetical protein BOSE21B_110195 [Bosea sp. 21B]|nr:hypothetical protein BOSE21B_110195 [Bosea sp. 21B]
MPPSGASVRPARTGAERRRHRRSSPDSAAIPPGSSRRCRRRAGLIRSTGSIRSTSRGRGIPARAGRPWPARSRACGSRGSASSSSRDWPSSSQRSGPGRCCRRPAPARPEPSEAGSLRGRGGSLRWNGRHWQRSRSASCGDLLITGSRLPQSASHRHRQGNPNLLSES